MFLSVALSFISTVTRASRAMIVVYPTLRVSAALFAGMAVATIYRGSQHDVYNILWAVVFGFATLNILSLAAKRFEPNHRGLSFGELLAVMVVLLSVFLLAVELFNLFHIFPIKLQR